ncbi:MAG: 4Fe-4S binding protein [Chloroflexi bacterium]|nr:4Fe-4S binding protein [Chloroflexota bacterium]
MLAEVQVEPAPAPAEAPPTLVLLCQDAEGRVAGLDLAEVAQWLTDHLRHIRVVRQKGLCSGLRVLRDAVQQADAHRLVLGLCSDKYPQLEVQAYGRRAGLDPLGIQAVNLGDASSATGSPSARAKLLLAAAVARARAFRGSRPENLKAALFPGQQEMSRRALFTLPPVTYVPVPTIDRRRCAAESGCAQCAGACPHDALAKDGDVILVERARCQSCGLCVAACPQRAVELPGWSPDEIEAQLTALLDTDIGISERAVLLICKDARGPVGDGWLPVRVPCVAMVPVAAILHALAQGAAAVALYPCEDDCPHGQGEALRGRVDYCQRLLWLMGRGPESVRVVGANTTDPAPLSTPPVQSKSKRPTDSVVLFGREAAALALETLTARCAFDKDLVLEHPHSPLGVVRIDSRTCTGCGACASSCPTGALSYQRSEDEVALAFDPRLCAACGQCVPVCPEKAAGAIAAARVTDMRLISRGIQVFFQDQEARCHECGAPIAARAMLTRVATILGEGYNAQMIGRLCADCRQGLR